MGRKLWGGEAIGEDTPGLKRSRVNKQKVCIHFNDLFITSGFAP